MYDSRKDTQNKSFLTREGLVFTHQEIAENSLLMENTLSQNDALHENNNKDGGSISV